VLAVLIAIPLVGLGALLWLRGAGTYSRSASSA